MKQKIVIWLLSGCLLILLMVVVGGITRLTQSGLSIVEWKPVTGTLPPLSEESWLREFELYKQSPEHEAYRINFTLSDYKRIYFWEYIHRLLGRLIGLVFLIPCIWFWRKGAFGPRLKKQVVIIFLGGLFQGVLGWYMVKSGLVDMPHVSHYRLAAHLITALALMAYIFWVALEVKPACITPSPTIHRISKVLLGLLGLQIVYGAFVAGLKAGKMYTTFPQMGTGWFPEELGFVFQLKGLMAFLEHPGWVQFIHRGLAYSVVALGIYLVVLCYQHSHWFRAVGYLLMGAILLQFFLGALTLVLAVPITLGVLHQLGAAILVFIAVYLLKISGNHPYGNL
jgi:heme a synthase